MSHIYHYLFLLLGVLTAPVYSQRLVFENIGTKQGLPATEVYNLFQDRLGYIWVFTEYGIVKHNGTKFVPACTNIPPAERAGYAVAESPDGALYFANSRANVYRVKNNNAFRVLGILRYSDEIFRNGKQVTNLFIDDKKTLYLASIDRSFVVPGALGISRPIVSGAARNFFGVRPLFLAHSVDSAGHPCIGVKDRYGKTVATFSPGNLKTYRASGYEFRGKYYCFFSNTIHIIEPGKQNLTRQFSRPIVNFKVAPNGHIWVGLVSGGLLELDGKLNSLTQYLGNITVSDILFDNQFGMWVSTIGKGIFHCKNLLLKSYQNYQKLNDRLTLLKVIGGKLFIGTASGVVYIEERNGLIRLTLPGNTSAITDVTRFAGKYYVGTKSGIYLFNQQLKNIAFLQAGIYEFCLSADSSLWMTSASRLLRKKSDRAGIDIICYDNWNRLLVERHPGEFFTVTGRGLTRYDSTLTIPAFLRPLIGKTVSTIRMDAHGDLWIGTKGYGIYLLTRENKLIHRTDSPAEFINDIRFDDGLILLSTNKGAFIASIEESGSNIAWTEVLDDEVLEMAVFDDRLMIGTTSGLVARSRDNCFVSSSHPFYLSEISCNTVQISKQELKQLQYFENNLRFGFDILAFGQCCKQLRYRLAGPVRTQTVVEGSVIQLQNLSPGKYKLLVYAVTGRQSKATKQLTIVFNIHPAFWQTWLFQLIVMIVGIVLVLLVYRWILSRRNRKELERKRIEKLLAEYQLTALKAQVDPHFMSNSLVAVQELIITNRTSDANHYIAKFSLLLRSLLEYSDQPLISLRDELRIIDLYVDLEQLRFKNRFQFESVISEAIIADQLYIPSFITQPLIENAIWHGLLPLKNERLPQLRLSVDLVSGLLVITVEDNGVGRKEPTESIRSSSRKSKGVSIILNRIENLNKLYTPGGAKADFIDLRNDNGESVGTLVRLSFPITMINQMRDE